MSEKTKSKAAAGKKVSPKTAKSKAVKKVPAKATKPAAKKTPAKKNGVISRKSSPAKPAIKTTSKASAKKPSQKKLAVAKTKPAPTGGKFFPAGEQHELLARCVRALDDKKAEALRVIYIGDKSDATDYFVIATGTSDTHLRALRIAIEKALDDLKITKVRFEMQPGSGWCVVDAFDVMVHLFLPSRRADYKLESLWKDGIEVPVKTLL